MLILSLIKRMADAHKPTKIPKFSSKSLFEDNKVLTDTDIINKITIINFFASWCIPCKAEHDLLMSLKKKFPDLNIIGFNHKDKKEDALAAPSAPSATRGPCLHQSVATNKTMISVRKSRRPGRRPLPHGPLVGQRR